ncbi:hypothetical protein CY0110_18047 [Crocosphaera chwakensis CCY0110]|uniref:Uncharacterized protein n=1 Tax=Crocosphaera chwakensis CCY0110 TaxID=391612 RepID=A3IIU1_9CHRO|nr:hypothetical protein CY0110_18047 [Crocosphaera chwakensis CCY0110]
MAYGVPSPQLYLMFALWLNNTRSV